MQTSHQNRNQQMPVIGAGRDAIQQQHALETVLVQMRAELSAELSASWEARLAAVEAERLGWCSTRRVRAGARRRPYADFQLSCKQWPINGQSTASLTPALCDLRLVAVAEGVPQPPSSSMAVRRSQRLKRPSSAPE
jgi:hypothetical protein